MVSLLSSLMRSITIIMERIRSNMDQIYLSRRNLETLLSKLNRRRQGEDTACTLIKRDDKHNKYPQTMTEIAVTAVEDGDYYTDRIPGLVYPADRTVEGNHIPQIVKGTING
jgi:hypothetical protein